MDLIKDLIINNKETYLEVHIEFEIPEEYRRVIFGSPVQFIQKSKLNKNHLAYHEFIEYNPVTEAVINELIKLKKDEDYNPNHITECETYLVRLIENLDSHWH